MPASDTQHPEESPGAAKALRPQTIDGKILLASILILFILVVQALPNLLPERDRERSRRLGVSSRALATAIETYFVDHHAYPAWTTATTEAILGQEPNAIDIARYPTFRAPDGSGLATLTTPAACISKYYPDIFAPDETAPFRYRATEYSWLLWSAGPNRQYEISGDRVPALMQGRIPNDELSALTYDPTNGVISSGDVWRIKQ